MTQEPMLGYGRQSINDDDIAAVTAALRGDYLTQGPLVERFESRLAEFVGARFAVAVANGTAALHIAALAAGMGPGSVGVTQTLTFVASANASLYCGGRSRLVDVEPAMLSMDVQALAAAAEREHLAMVVPVHFAGLAGDMAAVAAAARGAAVVEDACHALGGHYADGRPVGCCAHSAMTVFSFHPVKPVTTGEGGAITTNDPDLAARLRRLRSHGIVRSEWDGPVPVDSLEGGQPKPWYYEQRELGFNYRLSDIQAALGLSQMDRLETFVTRRRDIARYYDERFSRSGNIALPQSDPAMRARSGHHLYLLHVDFQTIGRTRTQVMLDLRSRGIGTQVHYIPVHHQPYHVGNLAEDENFPVAERHYARCLSLPFYPGLTDEDVERVVSAVHEVLG